MRIALKLACASVVLLAGCSTLSSLNPFSKKAPPSNPPAALVEFKSTLATRKVWSIDVGRAGSFVFSPVAVNNDIYAAGADGTLVRVDGTTGHSIWRISAGTPLTAGVGADANTVVVVAEKGVILAFDRNGKPRWKAQASSEVLSAPAVAQGLVVVRSIDNQIAAYDADSGVRRWIAQRTVPSLTLRSAPGIVISGPTAFVSLPGGRLAALALGNGGTRWEAAVGDPRGATELERIADTSGLPVLLGSEVCAVAYHGRVSCFDATTGAIRWAKELSSEVGLGADGRHVYAANEQGAVSAFDYASGASVWRNTKLANRRLSAPIAYGKAVAVGDYQGYIHFLSREDGAMLARVSTDGSQVIGTPLVVGSNVIFQTKAGAVVALTTD